MTSILAIDTSTEACSVALSRNGEISGIYEIVPRRHSQCLLAMLQTLLPEGITADGGLDAIAYGSGPGSFTGLRIAASAVQGLCFAAALPAVPVSTLACQVQTALRLGLIGEGEAVLSTLDAHIGELYWALYQVEGGLPRALTAPAAAKPGQLEFAGPDAVVAIGSGLHYLEHFREVTQRRLCRRHPDLLPAARDLLPLAQQALLRGQVQTAEQVCPVYVRDEINWKKIAEQGPRS
jgi:tRNA threonylcarbamoyladenosine biosynthesis protein TsaB